MSIINVDFEFDFKAAIDKAYSDDEIYQDIAYIAKAFDLKADNTEKLIRELIKINSTVLAEVLTQYNRELLNEILS